MYKIFKFNYYTFCSFYPPYDYAYDFPIQKYLLILNTHSSHSTFNPSTPTRYIQHYPQKRNIQNMTRLSSKKKRPKRDWRWRGARRCCAYVPGPRRRAPPGSLGARRLRGQSHCDGGSRGAGRGPATDGGAAPLRRGLPERDGPGARAARRRDPPLDHRQRPALRAPR